MRESVEIQYLFSRNFAQIQVLRENAQKFVRAKISTNKIEKYSYNILIDRFFQAVFPPSQGIHNLNFRQS